MRWLKRIFSRQSSSGDAAVSEPEGVSFPATPYAGLLVDLIDLGLTAPQVVYVVHLHELAQAHAELRVRAEVNMAAAPVHKPRPVRQRRANRPAVNRHVNKANSRSVYMRDYMRKRRAKPRLVSRDGVLTDGGDAA